MPLPDDIQRAVSAIEDRDSEGGGITTSRDPTPPADRPPSSDPPTGGSPSPGDLQADPPSPEVIPREEHLQTKAELDRLKRELKEVRQGGIKPDDFKAKWKDNPYEALRALGVDSAEEDIEAAFINRYAPPEPTLPDDAPVTKKALEDRIKQLEELVKKSVEPLRSHQQQVQMDQEKASVFNYVKNKPESYPTLNALGYEEWLDWALQTAYKWHNNNDVSSWDEALPRLEKIKAAEVERAAKVFQQLSGRSNSTPPKDSQATDAAPIEGGDTPTPRTISDDERLARAIKAAQDNMRRREESKNR
jgi:hypothetical protein